MNLIVKHFSELTLLELYAAMRLRQEVFAVEQQCAYLDADGKDLLAYHVLLYDHQQHLVACSRLLPENVSYDGYVSIGRVMSAATHRRLGLGRKIMDISIAKVQELWPGKPIKIGAQEYLEAFYGSYGFVKTGEPYLEDGIRHIIMVLS
ncbi:MAG: GNAT family N-acetyltransferase [Chitinophagales bacterium]